MTHDSGRCGSYNLGPSVAPPSAPTRPGAGERRVRGTPWEREALSEYFGAGAVGARLLVAAMTLGIARGGADLSSRTGVPGPKRLARAIAARGRAERRACGPPGNGASCRPRRDQPAAASRAAGDGAGKPRAANGLAQRAPRLPISDECIGLRRRRCCRPGAKFPTLRAAALCARLAGHLVLARRHRLQDAPGSGLRTVDRSKPGDQLVVARRRRSLAAQILRPSACQKGSRKRRLKILPEILAAAGRARSR